MLHKYLLNKYEKKECIEWVIRGGFLKEVTLHQDLTDLEEASL